MIKQSILIMVWSCMLGGACHSKNTTQTSENQTDSIHSAHSKNPKTATQQKPIILFLGNSLTAGYGIEKNQAFPALIQNKLDSMGATYQVVNAGVSGETTAGGREKIDWYLKQKPAIFVLELGGNDALRGINPDETYQNLAAIIQTVQQTYPECKILLAGMEAPPNMGDEYTTKFRQIYPNLAQKYNVARIPFLLEIVGGNPNLNQTDGIHPTIEGHQIVAETVWKYLQKLIEIESQF